MKPLPFACRLACTVPLGLGVLACAPPATALPHPSAHTYRISRVAGWRGEFRDSILVAENRAWYFGGDSTERRGIWTTTVQPAEIAALFAHVLAVNEAENENKPHRIARTIEACEKAAAATPPGRQVPLCPRDEVVICEVGPAIAYTRFRPRPAVTLHTNCITTDSLLYASLEDLVNRPNWTPLVLPD